MMGSNPRDKLERPYALEYEASLRSSMGKGARPKGLIALVTWARARWADEVPDGFHKRGVWRDYGDAAVGASLLGAPQYSDGFRRYLEGSDWITDANPNDPDDPERRYAKPMHTALRVIAGTDVRSDHWYHAHFLFLTALASFDWQSVSARALIPFPVQRPYVTWAFTLWWDRFAEAPGGRMS
jgi:hypothetical protein